MLLSLLRAAAVASAFVALATLVAAAEHNTLTREDLADGWILLFDGQTDFGWKPTGKANWKVADGIISVSEGEAGFLYHTTQLADFALRADFRSEKETNSGVFLRSAAMYSTVPRFRSHTKVTYRCRLAKDFSSTPRREITRRFLACSPRATARSITCQASCQLRFSNRDAPRTSASKRVSIACLSKGSVNLAPGRAQGI